MEKREKTDFILEQMRLTLAKKDYTRMQIISRKINTKFFAETEVQVNLYVLYSALLKSWLIKILIKTGSETSLL
jgi:26S proteasome regulatory subunit N5